MGKISLILPAVFLMVAGHKFDLIYVFKKNKYRIEAFAPIYIINM